MTTVTAVTIFFLSAHFSTQHPLSGAVQFLQPTFLLNFITSLVYNFFEGYQGLNYNAK